MFKQQAMGWTLLALISSNCLLMTFAYPQQAVQNAQIAQTLPQYYGNSNQALDADRKFAEKPNAMKKVALDDIDDIQTNQISESGFSWSNMLGMVMQMFFNGGPTGPNKSDNLDTDVGVAPSPWANLLSMGLKILTAILGGGASNDGIDKVDNGSPMQFINIVVNLLDALKTSFSHRSMAARSIGRKDSTSDAAIAGIAMLKTYVKSFSTNNDNCLQKYVCEASTECSSDVGPKSVFCQLGTYATSFILERQSGSTFDQYYEAGRRGRSGVDCRQLYLQCNEV
ncbi:uncharacterized protein LOC143915664 isoform X2 [Arctopsyche grandis]|uniref:uncharacterized protein LOC143915664 isoform X2 n=1 Tax=Arctopsyche grandis TaxID=121162 RepID=UPI00406D7052